MGPHQGQPLLGNSSGPALAEAAAAAVLLHGRGDTAEGILSLGRAIAAPGVALVAPQADGNTWYPYRFTAPAQQNEPFLGSALRAVEDALTRVAGAGVKPERTALVGFSQGACLALEFAARNPRRFGAVVALAGGLIGADDEPRPTGGDLAGTPVLIGVGDRDSHISVARVESSASTLRALGAAVEVRIYAGLPHTVNDDEVERARELLAALAAESDPAI